MSDIIKIKKGDQILEAIPVEVTQATEPWVNCILDDGSILRLRTIVTKVLRLKDVYAADGTPEYVVQSQNIMSVTAPAALRKVNDGKDQG